MSAVKSIIQEEIAEQKAALVNMKAGKNIPPWVTADQHQTAIEECEARIASMQAKLDDPAKMEEWWYSIPVTAREQLLNA